MIPKFDVLTQNEVENIHEHSVKILEEVGVEFTYDPAVEVLKKAGGEYLTSVKLFDIYEGERIEAGKKSLAYSLLFQTKERTLTAEEINDSVERIKDALEKDLGAVLRS